MAENYDEVLTQLRAHGLVVDHLDTSGRFKHVPCEDRPTKKHGWYILSEFVFDGRAYIHGAFGDYRYDELKGNKIEIDLKGSDGKAARLSADERAELKRQQAQIRKEQEASRAEKAAEAARRAMAIWDKLPTEGASDYLTRKQVLAYGLRFTHGSVVVPMRNAKGELTSLQFIAGDGTKRFLTGGAMLGSWHWLGEPTDGEDIGLAEGYSTAATVRRATGMTVAAAFNAGNLAPVFAAIRTAYPKSRIVICGDDDHELPLQTPPKPNAGRVKATDLAAKHQMPLALPRFREAAGKTDWNDLHVSEGLDEVQRQIAACRESPPPAPPVAPAALDFTLGVLLEHFTMIHGTALVHDGRRGRLMSVGNLNHSAGTALVKQWAGHPDRKMVNEEDVVFDPSCAPSARPRVNLFTGMELEPDPGASCDRLIAHLFQLCSERDRLFEWVIKWLAYPLQHPGTKMATALVVYGSEGTGKNIFFDQVLSIYGRWGVLIGQEEIESQFNGWLSAKCFAVADEVVSRAELRHLKGRLKKLVTGQRVMVNEKNQPVREERNCMNVVFLSNEDEPLRIDPGDRRYCAIRCDKMPSPDYFEAIGAEIAAGGVGALYHYLLNVELEDFTPWTRPFQTDEREALMEAGSSPPLRFWDAWMGEELELPYVSCRAQDLYQAFRAWCSFAGERFIPNDTQFGTALRVHEGKLFRKVRPRLPNDTRPKCYEVVPLEDGGVPPVSIALALEQFRTSCDEYVKQAKAVRL